jgi:hypothetical protein
LASTIAKLGISSDGGIPSLIKMDIRAAMMDQMGKLSGVNNKPSIDHIIAVLRYPANL